MVDIKNLTRRRTPRMPFEKIANIVLGKDYELSLVLCGKTLSRRLNTKHRGKNKAANVLSFPLVKKAGEIFIDLSVASREARRESVSLGTRVTLLFIHGVLHLEGLDHGSRMEEQEQRLVRQFLPKIQK